MKIAIITAKFNSEITSQLELGCVNRLKERYDSYFSEHMVKIEFDQFYCPGVIELVYCAKKAIEEEIYDVVVVLGAVIKGDTDHYEYVCNFVTNGISTLTTISSIPIVFGILTVKDEQHAIDRADINKINIGESYADTAIEMAKISHFNF